MAQFRHSPSTSADHLRVLDVLPAASLTDALVFTLREVRYDALPVYSAISYTWDDQVPTVWVVCNHAFLSITKNCADILRNCRKTDSIITVWVDQMCIDQNSPADKNTYVSRMDEIYEKAAEVLVWIPDLDENDHFLLKSLGSSAPSENEPNPMDIWVNTSKASQEALRRGVRSLESKTWFHRMWTAQEAAVAKIEVVFALYKGERTPLLNMPDFMAGTYELWLLGAIQDLVRYHAGKDAPLSELLRVTLGRQCKDPRDKIFALYGLMCRSIKKRGTRLVFDSPEELKQQEEHFAQPLKMWRISDTEIGTQTRNGEVSTFRCHPRRYPPTPNYDHSIADVYIDTTWYFIQRQDWHILFIAAISDSEQVETAPTTTLPSWVPDYARMSVLARLNSRSWHMYFTDIYSTVAQLQRSKFPDWPSYDPKDQSLEIFGREVETVVLTSDEIPVFHDAEPMHKDLIDWVSALHESEYYNEHDIFFKDVVFVIFSFLGKVREQYDSTVSVTILANAFRFRGGHTTTILERCEDFLNLVGWSYDSADAQQQLHELPLGEAIQSQIPPTPEMLRRYEQWPGYEKEDRYDMWQQLVDDWSGISRHTIFYTNEGRIGLSLGTPKVSDSLVAIDVLDPAYLLVLRKAGASNEGCWSLVGGTKVEHSLKGPEDSEKESAEQETSENTDGGHWIRFKIV